MYLYLQRLCITRVYIASFSQARYFSTAGFAFVYFEDESDAEDAIYGLDNTPFVYDSCRLLVPSLLNLVFSLCIFPLSLLIL